MDKDVLGHFESIADHYDDYKKRNSYYYAQLKILYSELIPHADSQSIIELGCGCGDLISFLSPRIGAGIDISPKMISHAVKKHGHNKNLSFFVGSIDNLEFMQQRLRDTVFNFCIMPDTIEHLVDLKSALLVLSQAVDKKTDIIVSWANPLWVPLLHLLEILQLKMPEGPHHWPRMKYLLYNLKKTGFKIKSIGYRTILPFRIPVFSDFLNRLFPKVPILRKLCLTQYLVCKLDKREGAGI